MAGPEGPAKSLSARRAWIEIQKSGWVSEDGNVSLSARRAWIEIITQYKSVDRIKSVALRKESVDRNIC